MDRPYFAAAVDNTPLHALADGDGGGNGVYAVGGGFPTASYQSSNYWVDVVYQRALPGDTTPPTVSTVSPSASATGVLPGVKVTAAFSEPIDPDTVTTSSFELRGPGGAVVAATVSASGSTATLTPSAPLAASSTYTAAAKGGTGGVMDLAGNALGATFSWSFTTGVVDTTAPTVTQVTPASGATGVPRGSPITARFDEPVDAASVNAGTFELRDAAGALVAAAVAGTGSTTTLTPNALLAFGATYTATLKGGAAGVKDGAGNALAGDYSWSFTVAAAAACPCTLWENATPSTAATDDSSALELGVRFQSDTSGYITGIRFYKGTGNTGTHVGHLWTDGGLQLASATFTNETATGWQEVTFSSPVAINANTTYVASYFAPAGHFALDRPYFTKAFDNTPLHALADGVDGGNGIGNGVYAVGTGFPRGTYQSSNYWVDVLFVRTLPADTTAPTVTTVSPVDAATGVAASTRVTAQFSEAVDAASVTTSSFALRDPGGAVVTATVSTTGSTAVLTPAAPLAASTRYTATLTGGSTGIKDRAGNRLATSYSWSFTTAAPAGACPCSLFSSAAVPATPATADTGAIELGVRFQSDVDGSVTGIRFYKGPGNTGTHVGHLWTANGLLLRTATFTSESATGWQTVNFASPVGVNAGTVYVASYFAPAGHFAVDRPFFTTALDRVPLHAPADGDGGGNGVYAVGSAFPTYSYQASNYWVDVLFDRTVLDTAAPTTTTAFPRNSSGYNAGGWTGGCPTAGFCGTATDAATQVAASGVQKVELSIYQGTTGKYWNGTAFAGASEVFVAAAGTTSWAYPFTATQFPAEGPYTVRVRATDVAGNVELPTSQTFTFDTSAPSLTLDFPVAAASYNAVGWTSTTAGGSANPGCGGLTGFCGVSSDAGSGLAGVELSIRQDSTGSYWNGNAFASASEVYVPGGGLPKTTRWIVPFAASSFPGDGNYTIRVRATDRAGNVQALPSRTFRYDTTLPTSTVTFPTPSGSYSPTAWNAGCSPSGICGTASDTGSGLARVDISILQNASGAYWNGTAFASPTEVFFAAHGTTSWNYGLSGTAFAGGGTYTIRSRATDNAGNAQVLSTRTFTITG